MSKRKSKTHFTHKHNINKHKIIEVNEILLTRSSIVFVLYFRTILELREKDYCFYFLLVEPIYMYVNSRPRLAYKFMLHPSAWHG